MHFSKGALVLITLFALAGCTTTHYINTACMGLLKPIHLKKKQIAALQHSKVNMDSLMKQVHVNNRKYKAVCGKPHRT